MKLLTIALCFGFSLLTAADFQVEGSFHQDFRRGIAKTAYFDHTQGVVVHNGDAVVAFLQKHHAAFGLKRDVSNLVLMDVQSSLVGMHYRFQQLHQGVPVYQAEILVSVSKESGRIYYIYNNTYPEKTSAKRVEHAGTMDQEAAFETAWQHLRVHGPLMTEPRAELVYLPDDSGFQLAYITHLGVEAPFGHWRHFIHAVDGEILRYQREEVSSKTVYPEFEGYQGPVWDRKEAFAHFAQASVREKQPFGLGKMANGTGYAFETDPRTVLKNDGLTDSSPASAFEPAYSIRNLNQITNSNGTWQLVGPWISIVNFESPNTSPSTTTDGNWRFKWGNNGFNDSMTYFQIDQNQRYIQSLGFTGVQQNSIRVDTDGVGGDDNSYYLPGSNSIAFGHGCVDDSTESFTILHEYGHAIQYAISPNWDGGDTGAMGEGFSDYWGGSHRYSTANGKTFHPYWAFPWVGHNSCWEGRNLDTTSGQYDPNATYPAHEIVNGVDGDELWSTPLFQARVSLEGQGVSREDVDRILLQSFYGTGANMSMREMAGKVVATAQQLFPNGPHADVFTQKFEAQNILAGGSGGGGGNGGGGGGGGGGGTGGGGDAVALTNGQTLAGLSGTSGSTRHFYIDLPSGSVNLTIAISGGSGDADLYVKQGSQASVNNYDFRPYLGGNNESVSVAQPASGRWYIMIHAYEAYSTLSLVASFETGGGTGGGGTGGGGGSGSPIALTNGQALSNLAASTNSETHYYIDLPSGASNLSIKISGGNGDADLYVKKGSQAGLNNYNYRPYLGGNNETVSVASPASGRWYIMIHGYESYSGLTLSASFSTGGGTGGGGGGSGTTTATFSGSVSQGNAKYHNIQVSGGTINLKLSWSGSADLDLALIGPNGQELDYSWYDKPETISFNTQGQSGQYKIEVYDYQSNGSVAYTLEATYQP